MNGKKILVIEDDVDIREIIQLILNEEGYEMSALENEHDVDEELDRSRPDVMLGDMDGRDICTHLKSETGTAAITIIIVSATHGRQALTEKGCLADDFLQKPFDIVELVDKVNFYAAA